MKYRNLLGSLCCLLGIAAVVGPQDCSAQGTFGRVANAQFAGGVTIVDEIPISDAYRHGARQYATAAPVATEKHVDLGPALRQSWQLARSYLKSDIENFLHERDIGGGFRTSANHVTLAQDGQLFAGWDGRGFTIRFWVPGNNLKTRIRIPGPSAQSSDPALTVPFDLDLTIDVDVNGNQLVAPSARLQVRAFEPSGRNPSGRGAVAFAKALKFMNGPDLVGEFLKRVNSKQFSFANTINKELSKLNPALARASSGAAIVPGFDQPHHSIQLTLMKASGSAVR